MNNSNSEITPWLSVIIPIYNSEKYLDKCITSVLNQSFTSFELILVNDGSTDNTSSICKKYSNTDKRVKYFEKENGGSFKARLYGVEHAKGKYVTFCDSDDYYANKKAFNTMYLYLEKNNLDAMQFALKRVFNHLSAASRTVKQPLFIDRKTFVENEYPIFLCSFYDQSHLTPSDCNKVYKKEMLTEIPSSENAERIFWGDDMIFNMHALKNCRSMVVIPDILYVYRDNVGGTTRFSENAMKDLNRIKEYQEKFLESFEHPDKPKIISMHHIETACWFGDWITDGVDLMKKETLEEKISEILSYPEFMRAREYFMYENSLAWEAIELLKKADPKEYIKWAKRKKEKGISIREMIKQIYRTV